MFHGRSSGAARDLRLILVAVIAGHSMNIPGLPKVPLTNAIHLNKSGGDRRFILILHHQFEE